MGKPHKATVSVKGTGITVLAHREEDYIKPLEFEGFKNKAGLHSFVLIPVQWE